MDEEDRLVAIRLSEDSDGCAGELLESRGRGRRWVGRRETGGRGRGRERRRESDWQVFSEGEQTAIFQDGEMKFYSQTGEVSDEVSRSSKV